MLTESGLINYHNFSGLVITVRRGAALAFTNEALTNEKTLWIATDPTYTENRAGELYVATFFSNEPFAKIPKDAEISPIRIDYLYKLKQPFSDTNLFFRDISNSSEHDPLLAVHVQAPRNVRILREAPFRRLYLETKSQTKS